MKNLNYWLVKVSFCTSTLTASKNCKTRSYHRANHFTIRWQAIQYSRAITLTPRTSGSDFPSERSTSTVICIWKPVLLLADIFENFRESCIVSYGLDPAHYYTLLCFTWDAMLKYMRVKFEVLTDINMILFIERSIRGLNQCSSKYIQTNSKYMRSYDVRTHRNRRHTWYTMMLTIYTGVWCVNHCHTPNFDDDIVNFDVSAIAPD